jgi:hypothetical protein
MANERDFSFKCIKIALIVIHSLAILGMSILFIASIVVLNKSDKEGMDLIPEEDYVGENLSPEGKDTTRKFIHKNS